MKIVGIRLNDGTDVLINTNQISSIRAIGDTTNGEATQITMSNGEKFVVPGSPKKIVEVFLNAPEI